MTASQPDNLSDAERFDEIMARLDRIDEKVSFVSSETAQRYGRKIGRDIGLLCGAVAGLFVGFVWILFRMM